MTSMTINPQWQEPPPGGPMSVEEYLELDKSVLNAKYEYLDDVARLMSGGTGEHDQIAFNMRAALGLHFLSGPCFVRGSDMQVYIGIKPSGKEHYVYPDATISCDVADRRRGTTMIRSPRLVVEVLSPSTEKIDRGPKLEAYKKCETIQEIVLIDQFVQAAEVYRRNGEDGTMWDHVFYGPNQGIELHCVDVYISMDEVYRGIDFDEPLVVEE